MGLRYYKSYFGRVQTQSDLSSIHCYIMYYTIFWIVSLSIHVYPSSLQQSSYAATTTPQINNNYLYISHCLININNTQTQCFGYQTDYNRIYYHCYHVGN